MASRSRFAAGGQGKRPAPPTRQERSSPTKTRRGGQGESPAQSARLGRMSGVSAHATTEAARRRRPPRWAAASSVFASPLENRPALREPVGDRVPGLLCLPVLRHDLLQLHQFQRRSVAAVESGSPTTRPCSTIRFSLRHSSILFLHHIRAAALDRGCTRPRAPAQPGREGEGDLSHDLLHPLDCAARRVVLDLVWIFNPATGSSTTCLNTCIFRDRGVSLPGLVQALIHPARTLGRRPAMVIYLAGSKAFPSELYESPALDGARA